MEIPPGFEYYEPVDFKLFEGERVVKITRMKQASRLREYTVYALITVLGYELYLMFSRPSLSWSDMVTPVALLVVIYFLWHFGATNSVKGFVLSAVKYGVALLVLSYALTYLSSFLVPLTQSLAGVLNIQLPAVKGVEFSLDPVENAKSVLAFLAGFANEALIRWGEWLRYGSMALVALGPLLALLTFLDTRSYVYYVTTKRIIVRRKMMSLQVTDMPFDSVVEVTAFQSPLGRLLNYGTVAVALVSGGGVTQSLRPRGLEPVGSTYRVVRRVEGVPNVWELKDLIVQLRDKFVEAEYLARIEGLLTEIRDRLPTTKGVLEIKFPKEEREERKS